MKVWKRQCVFFHHLRVLIQAFSRLSGKAESGISKPTQQPVLKRTELLADFDMLTLTVRKLEEGNSLFQNIASYVCD